MILRPFLYEPTACASYLFGCPSKSAPGGRRSPRRAGRRVPGRRRAHRRADRGGPRDARAGRPRLGDGGSGGGHRGERPPAGRRRGQLHHHPLADGDAVDLGNTVVSALSTPGHAPATRPTSWPTAGGAPRSPGSSSPATRCWSATSGGRTSTRTATRRRWPGSSTPPLARLMELPDGVSVYPSHFGGSVCGRALSGNPFSTIGFERRHNAALAHADADAFAAALLADLPPAPAGQEAIVAANRAGSVGAPA